MAMTLYSPSKAKSRRYIDNSMTLFQCTTTKHGQIKVFQKSALDFQGAGKDRSLTLEQISLPIFKQRANKTF